MDRSRSSTRRIPSTYYRQTSCKITWSPNPSEAFQYSPVAEGERGNGSLFSARVFLRGFLVTDSLIDGLPDLAGGGGVTGVEDKQRVEILTGLDGFLQGVEYSGAPGGTVNWVYKKPTTTPLADVTIGDVENGAAYLPR